jgi:hypothetical protein
MIYILDSGSVTIAAANTSAGAIGTAKFVNGFWNNSINTSAVILRATIAVVSGTPAGPFFWNYLNNQTLTNAATGTIRASLLDAAIPPIASAMSPEVGIVLTTGSTPNLIQLATIGGPAAAAAGTGVNSISQDYADSLNGGDPYIQVPPGTIVGIMATGAGTTTVVQSTIYWREIPS